MALLKLDLFNRSIQRHHHMLINSSAGLAAPSPHPGSHVRENQREGDQAEPQSDFFARWGFQYVNGKSEIILLEVTAPLGVFLFKSPFFHSLVKSHHLSLSLSQNDWNGIFSVQLFPASNRVFSSFLVYKNSEY